MNDIPPYDAFRICDVLADGYCTNRHGVRIYYRSVRWKLHRTETMVWKFDIAPVGKVTSAIDWKRSTEWFWTEGEARAAAADIAYRVAKRGDDTP